MDKMKRLRKARTLMVGAISHDLRTPLNGIMLNIRSGLADKRAPEDYKIQYLNPALQNSNILVDLIDRYLEYTKEDFNTAPKMSYEPTLLSKLFI